jgi:hypothetical protein
VSNKLSYRIQQWADNGDRPDEWILKEWAIEAGKLEERYRRLSTMKLSGFWPGSVYSAENAEALDSALDALPANHGALKSPPNQGDSPE